MNLDDFIINFKVIDAQFYVGANVNREVNRLRGLRRIQSEARYIQRF